MYTGFDFDPKNYNEMTNNSVRPGIYMIETPFVNRENCYVNTPSVRMQKTGHNLSKIPVVDSESILKNIIHSDSKTRKYDKVSKIELEMNKDCGFKDEIASRIYDDKTTRRGQSIDRFDWTHYNPQSHAIERFEFSKDSVLMMKDSHRPCIPKIGNI